MHTVTAYTNTHIAYIHTYVHMPSMHKDTPPCTNKGHLTHKQGHTIHDTHGTGRAGRDVTHARQSDAGEHKFGLRVQVFRV